MTPNWTEAKKVADRDGLTPTAWAFVQQSWCKLFERVVDVKASMRGFVADGLTHTRHLVVNFAKAPLYGWRTLFNLKADHQDPRKQHNKLHALNMAHAPKPPEV